MDGGIGEGHGLHASGVAPAFIISQEDHLWSLDLDAIGMPVGAGFVVIGSYRAIHGVIGEQAGKYLRVDGVELAWWEQARDRGLIANFARNISGFKVKIAASLEHIDDLEAEFNGVMRAGGLIGNSE